MTKDPSADQLTESPVSSAVVYQGSFFTVKRDMARLPDGSLASREFVTHPGAAVVAPLFDDQRVIIERQYRYPLARSFIEFPAGKIDAGESALATAVRELSEETGYSARRFAHITTFHPTIGYSNEVMEFFVARELTAGASRLDRGEFLEVDIVPFGWLMDQIMAGRVTDTKTQACALWLERLISGRMDWPQEHLVG